ncbi:unnamed protein product (mitochondrion) [Plasmodiophora brassicae]|uniref:Uncharacterized protein n=1 Tax=Plasmodiophora brassicae TaxID=37360 RepID=A0A3P3Y7W6_PLABS|nr:unnamed protein product [Plasmodiophora brassicae]
MARLDNTEDAVLSRLARHDIVFRSIKSATPLQVVTAFHVLIVRIDGGKSFKFNTVNAQVYKRLSGAMDALGLGDSTPSLSAILKLDKEPLIRTFVALLEKLDHRASHADTGKAGKPSKPVQDIKKRADNTKPSTGNTNADARNPFVTKRELYRTPLRPTASHLQRALDDKDAGDDEDEEPDEEVPVARRAPTAMLFDSPEESAPHEAFRTKALVARTPLVVQQPATERPDGREARDESVAPLPLQFSPVANQRRSLPRNDSAECDVASSRTRSDDEVPIRQMESLSIKPSSRSSTHQDQGSDSEASETITEPDKKPARKRNSGRSKSTPKVHAEATPVYSSSGGSDSDDVVIIRTHHPRQEPKVDRQLRSRAKRPTVIEKNVDGSVQDQPVQQRATRRSKRAESSLSVSCDTGIQDEEDANTAERRRRTSVRESEGAITGGTRNTQREQRTRDKKPPPANYKDANENVQDGSNRSATRDSASTKSQ